MFKLIKRLVLLLLVAGLVLGVLGWRNLGTPAGNRDLVLEQYTAMQALLLGPDERADSVSGWSVHEHVEHLLLANEGIVATIARNRAPDEVEPKSLIGRLVLLSGTIPRGRGQAPDGTEPDGRSGVELVARCVAAEVALRALDVEELAAAGGVVGNHPYFGGFTTADWLRLMVVHDEHHLAIVADIQAAAD